jgi:SAM-dependent methyltransferase
VRSSLRKNRTRHSASIPAKLVRSGAFHLIPVYYLLSLSDLAREGIENSGSYRFADHIYAGVPSGRTAVGRWLDARLLAMPAACAFRARYQRAQLAVRAALARAPSGVEPLRILAVPCGIPRDIAEVARALEHCDAELLSRVEYYGMDIDPAALVEARAFVEQSPLPPAHYHLGDALVAREYPDTMFHIVISTGLGDFLNDAELTELCTNVYRRLEPGGTFYTSGSARDPRSDALLQMVELLPYYRSATQLEAVLQRIPWRRMHIDVDASGLQTYVTAVK